MSKLITTKEAAASLGTSERRVQQLATELGLGQRIPGGRGVMLFSDADVKKMGTRKTQRGPMKKRVSK
jgi:hypothetical protein